MWRRHCDGFRRLFSALLVRPCQPSSGRTTYCGEKTIGRSADYDPSIYRKTVPRSLWIHISRPRERGFSILHNCQKRNHRIAWIW
ncbi:hypothetical protein BS50DRAFT_257972 [Corynespora cassiicola Philippines]|uniref:Uncharacterized protein n=1 Tax=Corynespora cassiicola Philippines TaxID=1448308 RepID=A0A2T2N1I7_CORCC|nr:hypothetical protein BS50DRAFT_257972 [Corynespora cassiicola Philippines]